MLRNDIVSHFGTSLHRGKEAHPTKEESDPRPGTRGDPLCDMKKGLLKAGGPCPCVLDACVPVDGQPHAHGGVPAAFAEDHPLVGFHDVLANGEP